MKNLYMTPDERVISEAIDQAEETIWLHTGRRVALKCAPGEGGDEEIEGLAKAILMALGYSLTVARARRRDHKISRARQVTMYIIRNNFSAAKLIVISKLFNRDHTAVIHNIETMRNMLATKNEAYLADYQVALRAMKQFFDSRNKR